MAKRKRFIKDKDLGNLSGGIGGIAGVVGTAGPATKPMPTISPVGGKTVVVGGKTITNIGGTPGSGGAGTVLPTTKPKN